MTTRNSTRRILPRDGWERHRLVRSCCRNTACLFSSETFGWSKMESKIVFVKLMKHLAKLLSLLPPVNRLTAFALIIIGTTFTLVSNGAETTTTAQPSGLAASSKSDFRHPGV